MTSEKVEIFISVDQCKRAIVAAMIANIPVAVWGESGIGKSMVVKSICDKRGFEFFDFRMSDKEPTDAGGVPVPDMQARTLEYIVTKLIPWMKDVGDKKAALVFDEFDRSSPECQNMALQLVHDRMVNGNKLGENVVVILAGNGTSDTYTTPLSTAAARRMVHLYVSRSGEAGLKSYEKWAEETGVNPHHYGFARFCNETWSIGADEAEFEELGKPCPRTFDMAGRLYDVLRGIESRGQFKTEDIMQPLMSGCVGRASGGVYLGWRKMCEQAPNPKDVLDDPENATIPIDNGMKFALVASLADCTGDHETAERAGVFFNRVSAKDGEEIAAMGFRRMINKFPGSATTTNYIKWLKKHKELMQ